MNYEAKNRKILIVEDDDAHAELILRSFRAYSINSYVERASSLIEARNYLADNTPDLIVLDWVLPDGLGIDLYRKSESSITIPYIVMTSYGSQELAVEAMRSGALDYVVKNYDSIADIAHIVERALREWALIERGRLYESELKASEAKYRSLFEEVPVGLFRCDIDGVILEANPALSSILKIENLIGLNSSSFFKNKDLFTDMRGLLLSGKYENVELEAEALINNTLSIWIRIIAKKARINGFEFIDGSVENINEQKRSAEALKESELKYRRIFENSVDIYFETDLDGIILEISPKIISYSLKSREELIGKSILDFYTHPNARNQLVSLLLEYGKVNDFEAILQLDGKFIEASINAELAGDESGNQSKIVGAVRDIGQRKKNERINYALYGIANAANTAKNANELFVMIRQALNSVIESQEIHIAILNNLSGRAYFPYKLNDVEHKLDLPAISSLSEKIIDSGDYALLNHYEIAKNIESGDLDAFVQTPKSLLAAPLKIGEKTIGAITLLDYSNGFAYTESDLSLISFVSNQIALSVDRKLNEEKRKSINEDLEKKVVERTKELNLAYSELQDEYNKRIKASEELEKAKAELEFALLKEKQLNEIKNRFISTISHEYRTPLTVIISSADLLRMTIESRHFDKSRKYIEQIDKAANTLTNLFDNLLRLNKHTDAQVRLKKESFNLTKFLNILIEEFKLVEQNSRPIILNSKIPRFEIMADKNALKHIMTNLISNSIKYSPDKSPIEITLLHDNEKVAIIVSDEGFGVPADEIKDIFEPFYRARNVGSISGAGLGLSIVKKFVEKSGGSVSVKSVQDAGSTFIVELPISNSFG
jgi:PAS domain S-box-containing protein